MTNDPSIGERLNAVRIEFRLTQEAFAQSLGVKKGFLNEVLKGRKGIGGTILLNAAKVYPNLNLRWLITGQGQMFDLTTIYEYPPPELESGLHDQVQEGVKIQYLKKEGQLEAMARRLEEHERRLRDLEGKP